jgi:hypothetical protein
MRAPPRKSQSVSLALVAMLGTTCLAAGNIDGLGAGFPVKRHTIFHAFNWRLGTIVHRLQHLQEHGYDAVQISPVQKSIGDEWYARYQPVSYEHIEGLGSKEDLMSLCAQARRKGMIVIADLVFNHMAVIASRNEWLHAQHDQGKRVRLPARLENLLRLPSSHV